MKPSRGLTVAALAAATLSLFVYTSLTGCAPEKEADDYSKGRYLVEIASCNDCHTKNWMATEAGIPEADWLAGDDMGWNGPWGTTFAPNLRALVQAMSEDDWVNLTKNLKVRPPMPWWTVRAMSEDDLRALYRYIKQLGPHETITPASLPPGETPTPPYFMFVPPAPEQQPGPHE